MAQTILIKRSNTSGAVPTTSQLSVGELALNTRDGKIYMRKYVDGTTSNDTITLIGDTSTIAGSTFTGNLNLGDNVRAVFGTGNDLQIYHNGNNSFIQDSGTGSLFIDGSATVTIRETSTNENMAVFTGGGSASLYNNGSKKLETTSTGIQVGTFSGNSVAQISAGTTGISSLYLGDGSSGAASYAGFVEYNHTGDYLRLGAGAGERVRISSTGIDVTGNVTIPTGNKIAFDTDGLTYITEDQDERLRIWVANTEFIRMTNTTTDELRLLPYGGNLFSGGNLDVTGSVTADGLTVENSGILRLNDDSTTDFFTIQQGGTQVVLTADSPDSSANMVFRTASAGVDSDRLKIAANGDISFYDSSGNQGLFWDSSASSLGIGTTSINSAVKLQVENTGSNAYIRIVETGNTGIDIGQETNGNGIINLRDSANLRMFTAGQERFVINSSGSVGIGETTPAQKIHLRTSFVNTGARLQVAGGSGRAYDILSTTDGSLTITDANASSERMRIDSSGILLVGESADFNATSTTATGLAVTQDGRLTISRSGTPMYVNRLGSDGSLIDFWRQGAQVGSIGNNGTRPYFASTNCGIRLGAADLLPATSSGAVSDNVVSLGSSSGRWKDLYLSGNTQMGGNLDVVGQIGAYNNPSSSWGQMILRATDFVFKNAGSSIRASLDTNGNFLVGTTNSVPGAGNTSVGISLYNDGRIFASKSGNTTMSLNRNTNDGRIVEFSKDGTTVGSIGTKDSFPYFAGTSIGLRISGTQIRPSNSAGQNNDNAVDLGKSDTRFKDLYLSGKVNATSFELTGGGNRGVQITTANTAIGYINFGDPQDSNAGLIAYDHAVDDLYIRTGGQEAFRIDASQNLLVGKTAVDYNTVGHTLNPTGYVFHTRSANPVLYLNRTSSAGDIAIFSKDGTTVGSIGIESSGFYLDGEASHAGLKMFAGAIGSRQNGSDVDATIDLGWSGGRFKDLYLSRRVNFGGVAGNHFAGYDGVTDCLQLAAKTFVRFQTGTNYDEAARITADGNVGIGTSAPQSLLHVSHATAPTFRLSRTGTGQVWIQSIDSSGRFHLTEKASEGGTGYTRLKIDDTGEITFNEAFTFPTTDGSANQLLKTDGSGNMSWVTVSGAGASSYIVDADGDTKIQVEESSDEDKIRFDANGVEIVRMGFNSSSESTLEVVRNGVPADRGQITFNGSGLITDVTSGYHSLIVRNAGSEHFRVRSNGNVGIGESSPGEKLQVNGNIRADGSFNIGGTIVVTSSRGFNSADGTASAPTHTFHSDQDTGMYSASANTLQFTTGGTERLRIAASGNLGIGTASPSAKLHVYEGSATGVNIGIQNTERYWNIETNDGLLKIQDVTAGSLARMTFDTSGNVGIGTTAPASTLDVTVNGDKRIVLNQTGASQNSGLQFKYAGTRTWDIYNTGYAATPLHFYSQVAGASTMTLTTSGNVGIGNTAPPQKLTVNGAVFITDDLTSPGSAGTYTYNGTAVDYSNNGTRYWSWGSGTARGTFDFIQLENDGTNQQTAMSINSSGNVGIGTTNLSAITSTVATLSLGGTNSGTSGGIAYQTNGTAEAYQYTSGDFLIHQALSGIGQRFHTNNTERMRIDTSGNLIVGKTATTFATQGAVINHNGTIDATRSGDAPLYLNRLASDGNIIALYKASVAVGSIGNIAGDNLFISGSAANHAGLNFGTNEYVPMAAGANTDNVTNIGSTSHRFHDAHFGGTVNVGEDLVVTGNLTINGTTTTLNTATLNVEDKNITLNYGSGDTSSTADGAGITIQDAVDASNNATILWDASNDRFNFTHGIRLPDSKKMQFGDGDDLFIEHDGNNSVIRNTTGNLYIQNGTSGVILIQPVNNEASITAHANGAVELYHNGTKKLETTSTGVSITGEIDLSGDLNVGDVETGTTSVSTSATTSTNISSFSASAFRSAKYLVQVTNTTDSTYHTTEILIIHDGTDTYMTEYGSMFTGTAAEATFTSDISSGSVRLLATPASSDSMTFKVLRNSIIV